MKTKEIVQAEEIAQRILGILDASANAKQWQEMVDCLCVVTKDLKKSKHYTTFWWDRYKTLKAKYKKKLDTSS